jgi:hypothetical protein
MPSDKEKRAKKAAKNRKEPKPKIKSVKKDEALGYYNQIVCNSYEEFVEKLTKFIELAKPKA